MQALACCRQACLHFLIGHGGLLQSAKVRQGEALTCCRLRQPALFDKATEEEPPVNTLSAVAVEELFRASLQSWKRRALPHHLPGESMEPLWGYYRTCPGAAWVLKGRGLPQHLPAERAL